jgi:hypothetical protein
MALPDWWGNPAPVDTSVIDEEIYRKVREMMLRPIEVVDAEHADPYSAVNGGPGIFTRRSGTGDMTR